LQAIKAIDPQLAEAKLMEIKDKKR